MSAPRPRHLFTFVTIAAALSFGYQLHAAPRRSSPAHAGFDQIAPAFVANIGQTDTTARFVTFGGGRPIFITARDVRIVDPGQRRSIWLTFVDGAATAVEPGAPTGGVVNRLSRSRGADIQPAYRDVVCRRVWPGIDARIAGVAGGVEYSFEVAPGADPRAIRLRYLGADAAALNHRGELVLDVGDETIVDRVPVAYQRDGSRTRPVDVRFVQRGDAIAFETGAYDPTQPLVIDPTIVYSTYLGSSGADFGRAIAVDATGAAYVAGTTRNSDFPTTPGVYQPSFRGGTGSRPSDAFVAKINAAGTQFVYVTYLGGSGNDEATGIGVDTEGNAYVTGYTESSDFPATTGAFRGAIGVSGHDGFVTKLNATGSALVYSTFLGSNGSTDPAAIAVDSSGYAYITGATLATNLPSTTSWAAWNTSTGTRDAFLFELNRDGSNIIFGLPLGGRDDDVGAGIAVDNAGHAYVTGTTFGLAVTTPNAVQRDPNSAGFKSADGGATWTLSNGVTHSKRINAFAIDPQNPSIVWGGNEAHVLRSTDGGSTWFILDNGQFSLGGQVFDIAVNPATPTTVLITSDKGTFRTIDSGANWTRVGWFNSLLRIVYAPTNPSIVYGVENNGLVRSVDGGVTWDLVFGVIGKSIAIDPTNANVVYYGTSDGVVMKSTDGGFNWSSSVLPQPNRPTVNALAVDPAAPSTVVAATSLGLFRSTDGGATWTSISGFLVSDPRRLVFDAADGDALYLSGSELAKSTDRGLTWHAIEIRGIFTSFPIYGFDARAGLLFAGSDAHRDVFVYKINTLAGTDYPFMYGTYLGGSTDDTAAGIVIDGAGDAYVAMNTQSPDLPNTAGQPFRFSAIVKLNADASAMLYSSFIGPTGSLPQSAAGVVVDAAGSASVAGGSNDTGPNDPRVWLEHVDASGTTIDRFFINGTSSYTTPADSASAIAIDAAGAVYLTGSTVSTNYPTTPNAPQPSYGSGSSDAFITKVSYGSTPPPPPPPPGPNLALNKPVVVSSVQDTPYAGANAVDGSMTTRWSSAWSDPQWIYVDLGQSYAISEVILRWETAFGADYQVQVSDDASAWTTIKNVTSGDGGVDDLSGLSGTGRYVRIYGTRRGTQWGYSLWELEVYGTASTTPPPGGLPSPWTQQDVGAVGVAGDATYDTATGRFTVKGSGDNIWGTADSFHFVYQPFTGDGWIAARVNGVQNTSGFAKAGVMFRDGTGPSAISVILDVKPDGCVEFMARLTTGGPTAFEAAAPCDMPNRIKLERVGTKFTASTMPAGGTEWIPFSFITVSMPATANVGLAVTSQNNTALNTSTFDNVAVAPTVSPSPTTGDIVIYASDIPSTSMHGAWVKVSDATAAGGMKLMTPDIGVSNTSAPLAIPTDYVDVTFNAPRDSTYTIWLRMQATANSKLNDSVWVQFNDATVPGRGSVYEVSSAHGLLVNLATDSTATSLSGWGWQNTAYWLSQSTRLTLIASTGVHTIRIQTREDGAAFDQIVLSPTQYASSAPGPVSNDTTIVPKP